MIMMKRFIRPRSLFVYNLVFNPQLHVSFSLNLHVWVIHGIYDWLYNYHKLHLEKNFFLMKCHNVRTEILKHKKILIIEKIN